jgi:hypothetical protein
MKGQGRERGQGTKASKGLVGTVATTLKVLRSHHPRAPLARHSLRWNNKKKGQKKNDSWTRESAGLLSDGLLPAQGAPW